MTNDKPLLTERELEVLRLASFWTNKQIAEMLGISKKTVANHLYNAYRALLGQARSRARNTRRIQAIVKAAELGLIDLLGEGRRV